MAKRAVVLFNLGGPDGPEAVKPFLFNLFNDPAIITIPNPFRWMLAKLISGRRAPIAREIYDHIGGKSPLLELTTQQAEALETLLGDDCKVFVCMRYWHPMSDAVVDAVKAYGPDEVTLLPLYPQFSTTTSGSSFDDWHTSAEAAGLNVPTKSVCCYPEMAGWVDAQVGLIRETLSTIDGPYRILFSAHGLPKKIVEGGDPYQWQVEQTSATVARALDIPGLDWAVCYQSRVGRLEWLGPSTLEELDRAGTDGKAVVVVPIAFVSEHSETLVELDIEYREQAEDMGVSGYYRVAAVGTHPAFVAGLADLVTGATGNPCSNTGKKICPGIHPRCAMAKGQ